MHAYGKVGLAKTLVKLFEAEKALEPTMYRGGGEDVQRSISDVHNGIKHTVATLLETLRADNRLV